MKNLPHKASVYIRTHFENAFIKRVTQQKGAMGHLEYLVDLDSNDLSYHLEFNEQGEIISTRSTPVFEDDLYDGEFYGGEET